MGQTALFPSEGRRAEDFFSLKASAGFEPANLGTKGQHATSRPPKPLIYDYKTHVFCEHIIETRFVFSSLLFNFIVLLVQVAFVLNCD